MQIDKFEADIEILSAALKKKKSDKDVSLFSKNIFQQFLIMNIFISRNKNVLKKQNNQSKDIIFI
jgi:hypothetical protein